MVELYNTGKPRAEIARAYELTLSAHDRWISLVNATSSTHEKDNRTPEENELLRIRKENASLRLENEILKKRR